MGILQARILEWVATPSSTVDLYNCQFHMIQTYLLLHHYDAQCPILYLRIFQSTIVYIITHIF